MVVCLCRADCDRRNRRFFTIARITGDQGRARQRAPGRQLRHLQRRTEFLGEIVRTVFKISNIRQTAIFFLAHVDRFGFVKLLVERRQRRREDHRTGAVTAFLLIYFHLCNEHTVRNAGGINRNGAGDQNSQQYPDKKRQHHPFVVLNLFQCQTNHP